MTAITATQTPARGTVKTVDYTSMTGNRRQVRFTKDPITSPEAPVVFRQVRNGGWPLREFTVKTAHGKEATAWALCWGDALAIVRGPLGWEEMLKATWDAAGA